MWWPFGDNMFQQYTLHMHEMDEEGDKFAEAPEGGAIPSVAWDFAYNPSKLPELPELPDIHHGKADHSDAASVLKLIKIAAMDRFLIGLTNKGHVLKYGDLSGENGLQNGHWEYVSLF